MEKEEFVFFLKKKSSEISFSTSHQVLSDLVREIKYQCVTYYKLTWEQFNTGITRDLRLSEKILERYPLKGSEKRKDAIIDEFKKEYCHDIDKLIFSLTYNDNN